MADDPTPSELAWRLDRVERDRMTADAGLQARMDHLVAADVYQRDQQYTAQEIASLRQLVTDLQQARADDAKRLRDTRMWLIACVVVPLVGVLVPLLLVHGGA